MEQKHNHEPDSFQYTHPALGFHIHKLTLTPQSFSRGFHWHSEIEMVQVSKGELICDLADKTLTLKTGQVLLINSHAAHRLSSKAPTELVYIEIKLIDYFHRSLPESLTYIDEYMSQLQTKPFAIYENNPDMDFIFNGMVSEVVGEKKAFENYIKAYIYFLVAFMRREGMIFDAVVSMVSRLEEILPVLSLIDNNYFEKLSLEELGEQIGCNKFKLCRLFKSITGGTVTEYTNYVRLCQAERLLTNPKCSISHAATACGFTSLQYFNKVFQKYIGCTPMAFKKAQNKNA